MLNFEFHRPTDVLFGKGQEEKVGKLISGLGCKKVLIHYGGGSAVRSGLIGKVEKLLEAEGIEYVELGGVKPNPELPLVREGVKLAIEETVDFILAVGGGSVADSAKDIANGAANPDIDVYDFTLKKASPARTLKKGIILTLAAAGSEMSESCVITNPENGLKRGYNSIFNCMDFAIENPELTYSVSKYQTACGAVDIAMHTIERYFNPSEDTYLTDAIAEGILRSVIKAGRDAISNPEDYTARANMMWASSLAHNNLTSCGRGSFLPVHQLEHELSGKYTNIAHGAGLAALWPSWARYVYKYAVPRFVQFAVNVWGVQPDFEHPEETALEGIRRQEAYYREINMPTNIKDLGIKEEDFEELAFKCTNERQRVLPGYRTLEYEDIIEVYRMAYNA